MANKKQEKLQETIVNIAAQIVHEKHLYYIGLRKSKPTHNQLYKICAEYINLGLQNISNHHNMEIVPIQNKSALTIDERIADIRKPSIVEYAVHEYSFYVVRGAKKKYIITASGTIKEGIANKLTPEFLTHYMALVGVVNELLEYGCMMAMNQLHHSGVLYMDQELLELLDSTAKEQTRNDKDDTNNSDERDALYTKFDTIINYFIGEDLNMTYFMDTEAKQRPFIGVELVDANGGSDVTQMAYIKGKYEVVRTTGNEIDEKVLETIGKFMDASDAAFTTLCKKYKEELENV